MKSFLFNTGIKGNQRKKSQFYAPTSFSPAKDLRASGVYIGRATVLNWSLILFYFFSFRIHHPHTHSLLSLFLANKPQTSLPRLRWLLSICGSVKSQSACRWSTASVTFKSGTVSLRCRHRDGLMKPPTQPGHTHWQVSPLISCPVGFHRQNSLVSGQQQRRNYYSDFCFVFMLAWT